MSTRPVFLPWVPHAPSTCPICGAHMTRGKHLEGCKNEGYAARLEAHAIRANPHYKAK